MASHSFIVESKLSVEAAYARAVNLERVPEWDAGVQSSVSLPAGANGLRRFEVTLTGFDGAPTSAIYSITDSDAPNRFVIVGENDVFRAVDTLVFVATEDGSTLEYHGKLDLVGDEPPLSASQLDSMFPKIAAVAESGLTTFLNP